MCGFSRGGVSYWQGRLWEWRDLGRKFLNSPLHVLSLKFLNEGPTWSPLPITVSLLTGQQQEQPLNWDLSVGCKPSNDSTSSYGCKSRSHALDSRASLLLPFRSRAVLLVIPWTYQAHSHFRTCSVSSFEGNALPISKLAIFLTSPPPNLSLNLASWLRSILITLPKTTTVLPYPAPSLLSLLA